MLLQPQELPATEVQTRCELVDHPGQKYSFAMSSGDTQTALRLHYPVIGEGQSSLLFGFQTLVDKYRVGLSTSDHESRMTMKRAVNFRGYPLKQVLSISLLKKNLQLNKMDVGIEGDCFKLRYHMFLWQGSLLINRKISDWGSVQSYLKLGRHFDLRAQLQAAWRNFDGFVRVQSKIKQVKLGVGVKQGDYRAGVCVEGHGGVEMSIGKQTDRGYLGAKLWSNGLTLMLRRSGLALNLNLGREVQVGYHLFAQV